MTMQVTNLLLGNSVYAACFKDTRADGAIRTKKKTFGPFISNSHILLGEYVLSSPSSGTCLSSVFVTNKRDQLHVC